MFSSFRRRNEEAKDRSGLVTFPQLNRNENFPANRWTALLQAATMTGANFTAAGFTCGCCNQKVSGQKGEGHMGQLKFGMDTDSAA